MVFIKVLTSPCCSDVDVQTLYKSNRAHFYTFCIAQSTQTNNISHTRWGIWTEDMNNLLFTSKSKFYKHIVKRGNNYFPLFTACTWRVFSKQLVYKRWGQKGRKPTNDNNLRLSTKDQLLIWNFLIVSSCHKNKSFLYNIYFIQFLTYNNTYYYGTQ